MAASTTSTPQSTSRRAWLPRWLRRLPGGQSSAGHAAAYRLIAWLFLRGLGLIYLAAFASMAVQITALAGSEGIYPIREQLELAGERFGDLWLLQYPSLFWLWAGDWALRLVAWGGVGLAVLLVLGRGGRLVLVLLYLLYLSLYQAGQVFTNFQWDYLLLEVGFIAILLPGGSRLTVWLLRWVLFKLRFLSGIAKLLSGDESWRHLTALRYYFETQPIPHIGSWYAHHLPDWLLRAGAGGTLFVELVVPFFFFLPRRWRLLAGWITILWQLIIIATSNHNWLNLLTILLCLLLFDDRAVGRVLPAAWVRRIASGSPLPAAGERVRPMIRALTLAVALVLVPAGLVQATEMIAGRQLGVLSRWADWLEPYRIANRYHVFPKIETERIVLVIEASRDGRTWVPLDLRYAPDDPMQAPVFVVPHQPRVDWMLWFVPMGPVFLDWLERFLTRLMEGSAPVTGLLARPPLADGPPRMLRVEVYRYHFTTPAERAKTSAWWTREDLGPFYPLPYLALPGGS
jgi:hypothetical protein